MDDQVPGVSLRPFCLRSWRPSAAPSRSDSSDMTSPLLARHIPGWGSRHCFGYSSVLSNGATSSPFPLDTRYIGLVALSVALALQTGRHGPRRLFMPLFAAAHLDSGHARNITHFGYASA